MPERLTVTPVEASSVLVSRVFGGSYFSEEATRVMGGGVDFDDQQAARWRLLFQDEQFSTLLVDRVTSLLEVARSGAMPRGRRLTQRELRLVKLRCGLEDGQIRTLAEVGEEINRLTPWVHMLEVIALRKLRAPSLTRTIRLFIA